jgi:hypothetical protein
LEPDNRRAIHIVREASLLPVFPDGRPVVSRPGRACPISRIRTSRESDRQGFLETPWDRSCAARGITNGMLLGAGLWSAILVLARAIVA